MAKHIIRYLLEGNGNIPSFVEKGGFLPLNEELVGVSVDDQKRHLPASVIKMNEQDIRDRVLSINPNIQQADLDALVSNLLSKLG